MHAPVRVTPPAIMPVSLAEAKAHLRVDFSEDDALINGLIAAATEHLDGWAGVLGRALVEQTWRQDFDAFDRCFGLPVGPVLSIEGIDWKDGTGDKYTIDADSYFRVTDSGGREFVKFVDGFEYPSGLAMSEAVTVTYKAGYATVDGKTTVPAPLKVAILLLVGNWYANRETVTVGQVGVELPLAANALIAPYRRLGV
ncbi:Phage gp6-like head-tail connector protein OS=Afipia felis OX=1035 GN=NCTC12722_02678 PE=4 SV=1 [Afipia felis]